MKLRLKSDPGDSIKLGVWRTVILAAIIYVVVVGIGFINGAITKFEAGGMGTILSIIIGLPGSLLGSGLINGILLSNRSLSKASKVSLVIALVAFLMLGVCGITLGITSI